MSSIVNEGSISSSSNSAYIENVVKERCANLILTGKRANEGNHKIWRSYAEGTARALKLKHIVSQMDRVKNSVADQSDPLNLLSSDDEEEQNFDEHLRTFDQDGNVRDEGKQPSCLALLTLAKDIDELHRIVRHVLCVYARDVAQGYSVDVNGYKMFEKTELQPSLTEQELLIQQSAVRVVAISLLGKHKVGGWPSDVESELEDVDRQKVNRERSISSTKRVILPEFTCNVCKELMYEPVTTNCGHNFCRDCLVMWMQKKQKHTCPTCRNKIGHKWRMPVNTVVWNAMLTMYPERLKKRKREVEIEISARPSSKKRKLDDSMVECPNCGREVKSNRLRLHLRLCDSTSALSSMSPSRASRSATAKSKRSTRSGRSLNSVNNARFSQSGKKQGAKRKNNNRGSNNVSGSGAFPHNRPHMDDNTAHFGQSNEQNLKLLNAVAASSAPVENTTSPPQKITILSDANGKQIGAIDSSAVFHMKAGLDHLAMMEIRRLNMLGKSLSNFHSGVLSHMNRLHEAKISRGEISGSNKSLMPNLKVFQPKVDENRKSPAIIDEREREDTAEEVSWGLSNCLLQ